MVSQPRLYRFAMCTTDGDALGTVMYDRACFDPGEIIRQAPRATCAS
jgi:hypothetical protein